MVDRRSGTSLWDLLKVLTHCKGYVYKKILSIVSSTNGIEVVKDVVDSVTGSLCLLPLASPS